MGFVEIVSGPGARLVSVAGLALALSACSMGNMFAPATNNQALSTANPTQQELATASTNALPAIATECPPIKVKPGSEALFYYGKGGKVGNARDLNYQAVIEKQSRNCVVSNGLITVKMGLVGRLLLGPAGNQNNVNVPVRFSVERDGVPLFSERYEIPVTITPPNQSEEFVKVVENVAVPYTGGEQIVFYVGFDS